jgi:hypothetical protein
MNYILLFIFILNSYILSAKDTFYLSFEETRKEGKINNEIIISSDFVNITGDNRKFQLKLIKIDSPTEWYFYLCDPNLCLSPGETESNFQYPKSDTGHIKVTYFTGSIPDSANLDLVLTDLSNPETNSDTVHLKFVADLPNSINEAEKSLNIKVFPTCTNDFLFIKIEDAEMEMMLQIVDLLGRIYKKTDLNEINSGISDVSIKVGDLPAGMYFLLLNNQEIRLSFSFFVNKY